MNKEPIHLLNLLKKSLGTILLLAIIGELIFFPSLANFYGCLMAIISFGIFYQFLNEKYIRDSPFSFFMYLSMFMYRFLPLIATIIEGKPITYGFERPYETFIYEILLFLISSLAFYLACKNEKSTSKNNAFKQVLFELKFFEITPNILWGMGLLGFMIRIYNFNAGTAEYGDVSGKFISSLNYLMYAPLILMFPSLLNLKYSKTKFVWLYTIVVFVISIASNSRQSIITPIAIISLMFFLYVVTNNIKITRLLAPWKIIFFATALFLILSILSKISTAMLFTRTIRSDVDKVELFQETIRVIQNEDLMARLKDASNLKTSTLTSYQEGWTEHYVDNFMLERYANMRITDETLFYAEKKGYSNPQMLELFNKNVLSLFPTPLLSLFGIYLDKSEFKYSRGDFLYGSGFGGYRVTSHIGDGLATFGYWYFLLQFFCFLIIFKLLNTFTYYKDKRINYAPFGLMNLFTFLGMFRNAQGIIGDVGYIVRGYIQGIVTYLIIYYIVRSIFRVLNFNKKYISN
ncbi:hypothetical protein [Cellulophaga sp. E6(2014)]|uniref:hypothetical protein n=1 Tax=Cellulophaga sp. E6(2014) TaxID=1495334 RepID=UPI00051DA34D|nr:hypothetical protein [Cellulophaga sp. E6(2014)]KGK29319.1 hypothetical protein EL45_16625 [Cellulophaga sp. E6(2014)]